tara:strand:- start:457 stop:807 length:351 start_codon:yes stop_codon:yes gene_type:complete
MAIENKDDARFLKNLRFLQNYHNKSLEDPGSLGGKQVTMYLKTPVVDGKYYILPGFDQQSKKIIESEDEVGKRFSDVIEQGLVVGYDSADEALAALPIIYKQITGIDIIPKRKDVE